MSITRLAQTPTNGKGSSSLFMPGSVNPDTFSSPSLKYRQPIPPLQFDLSQEVEEKRKRVEENRNRFILEEKGGEIQIPSFGLWLRIELERSAGRSHLKDVASVCIEKALDRFMMHRGIYQLWDKLTLALTANNDGMFPDGSSDYTELANMKTGFRVQIPGEQGEAKPTRLHLNGIPYRIYAQSYAVACSIGMEHSHLATVLIIDGLRSQPNKVYGQKMDAIITDFYYLFARRFRRLWCNVKYLWEIKPCKDVQRIMAEIEESGIVS